MTSPALNSAAAHGSNFEMIVQPRLIRFPEEILRTGGNELSLHNEEGYFYETMFASWTCPVDDSAPEAHQPLAETRTMAHVAGRVIVHSGGRHTCARYGTENHRHPVL